MTYVITKNNKKTKTKNNKKNNKKSNFLPFKAGYLSFQIIVKERVVVIINKNVLTEAFRSHLLGD